MNQRLLPLEDRRAIDALRYAFNNALAGDNPLRIEDQLAAVQDDLRGPLLVDLLFLELEHRRREGDRPDVDEYRARFPELAAHVDEAFGDLSRLAKAPGAAVPTKPLAEHRGDGVGRGLKVRCPYCHSTLELAPHAEMGAIDCPSCGSNFSLVDTDSTTRSARTVSELGHFRLVERLGVGGFGTVWKALDTELDRSVAIKIPRSGHLSPEEEEQFLREARSSAQLSHPHIVSVHEVGREGDTIYIVSDFVRGVPLSDVISGARVSTREAVSVVRKLADALQHAHDRGIVHRDVKPQNVIVDDFGEPHLMDFGIAKRDAGEVTITLDGVVLGTPAYMSPEQAGGDAHSVDGRTDVYSLGVVLYQMLTGELPFRGAVRMLIHQVLNDPAPSPRRYDAAVPRDLETIILKCLEKDPARRYQTARELGDELRRWSEGEPILARPVSSLELGRRWVKKNPMTATVLGLIAALAIGGPIVAARENWLRQENSRLLESSRRLAYGNLISVAFRDIDAGEFEQARNRLMKAKPLQRSDGTYYRNWEYDFLISRCNRITHTIHDTGNPVLCTAISSDGEWIAWGCGVEDSAVHVASTSTWKELPPLEGHDRPVLSVAFAPKSRGAGRIPLLATAGRDGKVCVWDPERDDGETLLYNFDYPSEEVWAVAFSPDGRFVAAGGVGHRQSTHAERDPAAMHVWDLTAPDPGAPRLFPSRTKTIWSVAFSSNGRVAAGDELGVRTWDAESGASISMSRLEGDARRARTISFDARGERIAVGGKDKNVRVVDVSTGETLQTMRGHTGGVESVAFFPDGKRIASSSKDRTIRIWSADSPRGSLVLRGHTEPVPAVAISLDGARLASGGRDRRIRIWNASAISYTLDLPGHKDKVRGLEFSRDGRHLKSSADDGVKTWDVEAGHEVRAEAADFASADEPASAGRRDDESAQGTLTVPDPRGERTLIEEAPPTLETNPTKTFR